MGNYNQWFVYPSTHYINGEVVDKPNFLWTKEDKRNFKLDFKATNFFIMSLGENQFLYVLNCNFVKCWILLI